MIGEAIMPRAVGSSDNCVRRWPVPLIRPADCGTGCAGRALTSRPEQAVATRAAREVDEEAGGEAEDGS